MFSRGNRRLAHLMKILFIHQNFPGQFPHLAPALVARGHQVIALTDEGNKRPSPVKTVRYGYKRTPFDASMPRLAAAFAEHAQRGEAVARACQLLSEKHGFTPDVVFGHIGWGETMFLKEIWPQSRLLLYAELFYRPRGLDTGFDRELQRDDVWQRIRTTARQAHLLLAMNSADKAVAPTAWQARSFPDHLSQKISVIHDGIDTDKLKPDPTASVELPGMTLRLKAGDEVLTFVNRNLEPYRGYHVFMRALPAVLAARPQAHVVIVGGDDVSYGGKPPQGGSWKQIFLDEVKDRLDLSRVHYVGKIPYGTFVALMRVSRVHAYLTYPFVLSWSMLEAMSAGALVVGSRTPPVEEVIEDGRNGRLVDFFDVAQWSAVLAEALAEPKRHMALREAGRRTIIERYDLKTVCLPRMTAFVEA
jgi:glycosyltransferase involved in cell wall biosynthesis